VNNEERVARCIDGEIKIAIAAVEEASRLMSDSDSPLTNMQVLLYQDRFGAVVRDLRLIAEMTGKTVQSST